MQLFIAAFESAPDPRAENVRHDLGEILIVAFIAVLCGAQGCAEMAEFGGVKIEFFWRFLKLKHGIPSHDTFSTVFRMIDPKALDAAFGKITARLVAALAKSGVIAIDGKSLKGAYDKGRKSSPKMMVSAYAAGLRLTLATVAAKDGNEVDAALEVIGLIDLEAGSSPAADNPKAGARPLPTARTETRGHGRIETRAGVVVEVKRLAEHHEFPGLKAFGRVTAMQVASEDEPRLIQVPASPEVVAKRQAAANAAGIPISRGLAFDWVPAPKEATPKREAFNPLHPGGIYKPRHTRPLTNEEWAAIADLLPGTNNATLSYRKFINDILRYVVNGWSWRDVGYGQHYPASRERVRRKRGLPVWAEIAARVESWGDRKMMSQMLRVCRWLSDPSDMSQLAVAPNRRFRSKAQLAAEQKKRSEFVHSDKVE